MLFASPVDARAAPLPNVDLSTVSREIRLYAENLLGNDFPKDNNDHVDHRRHFVADSQRTQWYNELMTILGAYKDDPERLEQEFVRFKRRVLKRKYY